MQNKWLNIPWNEYPVKHGRIIEKLVATVISINRATAGNSDEFAPAPNGVNLTTTAPHWDSWKIDICHGQSYNPMVYSFE